MVAINAQPLTLISKLQEKDANAYDKLERIVTTMLPTVEGNREAWLRDMLTGIPAELQDLIAENDYNGGRAGVSTRIVQRLVNAGGPERERQWIAWFLRRLANTQPDYANREFILGLFDRFQLDRAVRQDLPPDAVKAPPTSALNEKVFGEDTMRHVGELERFLRAAQPVVYLNGPQGMGTGFVVAEDADGMLVMTCQHVVTRAEDLRGTEIAFNKRQALDGTNSPWIAADADAEGPFFAAPAPLDVAVFAVRADAEVRQRIQAQLPDLKPLPFAAQGAKEDQRANIIEHPGGGPKKISIQGNFILYADSDIMQYRTATEPGSSGAPVLNDNCEVIGIHKRGGELKRPGTEDTYLCNEASTTQALLNALKADKPEIYERVRPK